MGYEICLTETDRDRLVSNHSERIAEALEDKIRKKNEELQWVENFKQLTGRFYNFFGSKGQHIAEINFTSGSKQYRGIFLAVPEAKKVIFCSVVPKGQDNYLGSDQDEVIRALQSNPKKVQQKAKDKILEQDIVEI